MEVDTVVPVIELPFDFVREDFEKMMVALSDVGASDITIVTGKPVMVKLHGLQGPCTHRSLQESEVRKILDWVYGGNGEGEIARKRGLNNRFEVSIGNNERVAFRMNAVGCLSSRGRGHHITLRAMPREVPSLDGMDVPTEIVDSIKSGKGCVAVVGETGSGKSTLLAALMHFLIKSCKNRKIVTFEAPIEYDLTRLQSDSNLIVQCEIGDNLPDFYEGVCEALRQAPTDILIGEARNRETIMAMLQASESGHAAYVTIHAESVRTTFTRIAQEFDSKAFEQTIFKLLTQMRVIVCQRLALPPTVGRRVPIREWLVITPEFREKLLRMTAMDALLSVEQEVVRLGQSFSQQALKAYKKRKINAAELAKYIGDEAIEYPDMWPEGAV